MSGRLKWKGTVSVSGSQVRLKIDDSLEAFKEKIIEQLRKKEKNHVGALRAIEEGSSFAIKWHISKTGKLVRDSTDVLEEEGVRLRVEEARVGDPPQRSFLLQRSGAASTALVDWLKDFATSLSAIEAWTERLESDADALLELPACVVARSSPRALLEIYLFVLSAPRVQSPSEERWEKPLLILEKKRLGDLKEDRYASVDLTARDWKQRVLLSFLSRSGDSLRNEAEQRYPATRCVYVLILRGGEIKEDLKTPDMTRVPLARPRQGAQGEEARGFWLLAGEVAERRNDPKTERLPLVIFVYAGKTDTPEEPPSTSEEEESDDEYRGAFWDADVVRSTTTFSLPVRPVVASAPAAAPDLYESVKETFLETFNKCPGQEAPMDRPKNRPKTYWSSYSSRWPNGPWEGPITVRRFPHSGEEPEDCSSAESSAVARSTVIPISKTIESILKSIKSGQLEDAAWNFEDVVRRVKGRRLFGSVSMPKSYRSLLEACHLHAYDPSPAVLRELVERLLQKELHDAAWNFEDVVRRVKGLRLFGRVTVPEDYQSLLEACHLYAYDPSPAVQRASRTLRAVLRELQPFIRSS